MTYNTVTRNKKLLGILFKPSFDIERLKKILKMFGLVAKK